MRNPRNVLDTGDVVLYRMILHITHVLHSLLPPSSQAVQQYTVLWQRRHNLKLPTRRGNLIGLLVNFIWPTDGSQT